LKLNQAGERAVIELARKICRTGGKITVGVGDDAAVLKIDGTDLIATTDMLAAQTHFPSGITPEQMARKAVVASLSDLAAMGARPLAVLFSVAFPRDLNMSFVRRMLKAMDSTAREYGAYVIGGDLGESGEIILAGVALGLTRKGKFLRRSGAKAGDLVAVTGTLGRASAGLRILMKKLPQNGFRDLMRAQLEPRARVREGEALAKSGFVTAAIDLSDGLASDLWQLSKESEIKITIERGALPADHLVTKFVEKHGLNPDDFVLFGGEDFELLFTVKPHGWKKVSRSLRRIGTKATPIGHVERGKGVYIEIGGKRFKLPNKGFEHFR
jgi:thiamine-monophosphate kinase